MPFSGILLAARPPAADRAVVADPGEPVPVRGRPGRSTPPTPTAGSATVRRPAARRGPSCARSPRAGDRFRCGPDPVTIVLERTAKVVNTSRRVVIDGGGLVTLSGGGERRIIYQNTCDPPQTWTTTTATTSHPQARRAAPDPGRRRLTGETQRRRRGCRLRPRRPSQDRRLPLHGNRCDRGAPTWPAPPSAHCRRPGGPVYAPAARPPAAAAATVPRSAPSACPGGSTTATSPTTGDRPGRQPPASRHSRRRLGRGDLRRRRRLHVLVAGTTINDNHAREGGGAIFFVSNHCTGT